MKRKQSELLIEALLRPILERRFEDIEIVCINVMDDFDEYGELILKIQVVFDAKKKQLDATKISGLVRETLPVLAKAKREGFPVFSFIDKAEFGKLGQDRYRIDKGPKLL